MFVLLCHHIFASRRPKTLFSLFHDIKLRIGRRYELTSSRWVSLASPLVLWLKFPATFIEATLSRAIAMPVGFDRNQYQFSYSEGVTTTPRENRIGGTRKLKSGTGVHPN